MDDIAEFGYPLVVNLSPFESHFQQLGFVAASEEEKIL